MDPDMHTMSLDTKLLKATLLNMYNPILTETILKKLREQSEKNRQMKTAGETTGSVPETLLDRDPILKERGKILGMTIRKISTEDPVLIASLDWCTGSWHNQSPC